jgi:nicotinamide-nucleotide amidase
MKDICLNNGNQDSMERIIVNILKDRGWHISFAESCTGGLAVARLVGVPDASWVLDASVVTYANEAKISYLGVSPETISAHGVVSEQVASEMAMGVAKNNHAEVGVGISGIAGPGGGTDTKPVGMVCFGFYVNGDVHSYTKYFGNIGRNQVREASVDFVYETLVSLLENVVLRKA